MPSITIPKTAAALLASVSLSACVSMAPDYQRPEAPVPDAVSYTPDDSQTPAQLLSWRDIFPDPRLQALIETALENNRDLRVSTLNVERARALYRIQRADSLPNVTASGDYSRQRLGPNATTGIAGTQTGGGNAIITERFSVSAAVSSYELDLFGRVRSLNRRALDTYFATQEAQKAARVALIAEVANTYLRLSADNELLALAYDTIKSQQESLNLTTQLVENGAGTDLDIQRARTAIERARADAATLEAQVAQDKNALQLLLGASTLPDAPPARRIDDIALLRNVPTGIRSDVLLARPDVLSAENSLKAANANIGAARAAFFPRILLTGSAGTTSSELSNLFSGGTGVWSFAPSISVPIFTGGRNRAQLAAAKVDRKIAQADYEKAIQTAFREVADALATRSTIDKRLTATENLAETTSKVYDLSNARFRNGVDDYLSVLDAQRNDYAARQELVSVQLAEAASVVALYRALGG